MQISKDAVNLLVRKRDTMPTTYEELWQYCKIHFGMHFPRVQVVEYATPPFELLWKLYNQDVKSALGIGPRHGSKTTLSAANHVLSAVRHANCEVACIAFEKQQAHAGYRQVRKFLNGNYPWQKYHHLIQGQMKQSDTEFTNGSRISIVTGTASGVNSAHVHRFTFDEIDLLENEQVYEESLGMMADSRDDLLPSRLYISSWKKPEGMVTKLWHELDKDPNGLVARWTWKEVCKPCQDNCEDCKKIVKGDRTFWDVCQGSIKKADGFINPDFYREIFKKARLSTWRSQYESLEPEIDNPIFPGFDERCIGEVKFNPNKPYYLGIDFGIEDPSAIIFGQIYNETVHIFHEIYIKGTRYSELAKMIIAEIEKRGEYPANMWVDASAPEGYMEIGHILTENVDILPLCFYKKIEKGIAFINRYIDGVSIDPQFQKKRFYVDSSCKNLIREMKSYHRSDKGVIQGGEDHACDALRYMVAGYEETYRFCENENDKTLED